MPPSFTRGMATSSLAVVLVRNEMVLVLEKDKTCRERVPSFGLSTSTSTNTREFLR